MKVFDCREMSDVLLLKGNLNSQRELCSISVCLTFNEYLVRDLSVSRHVCIVHRLFDLVTCVSV